jgi:putative endonuclease
MGSGAASPRSASLGAEVVAVGAGRAAVGRYGEQVAARHLVGQGMRLLARGWRCRYGEIDIIALDGGCLVVCEVKTRRSLSAGGPFDAVTHAKLARLRRLTAVWLAQQETGFPAVRIDVVGVVLPPRGAPLVEHLRAVG